MKLVRITESERMSLNGYKYQEALGKVFTIEKISDDYDVCCFLKENDSIFPMLSDLELVEETTMKDDSCSTNLSIVRNLQIELKNQQSKIDYMQGQLDLYEKLFNTGREINE